MVTPWSMNVSYSYIVENISSFWRDYMSYIARFIPFSSNYMKLTHTINRSSNVSYGAFTQESTVHTQLV